MKNSSKLLVQLAYLYVILPVVIFVVGWCNLPTACIGGIIILISLYFTCKNAPALWQAQNSAQKRMLLFIVLISLVWVYLSGIGALAFQNTDHNTRNPIFEILVQNPWPVVFKNPPVILTYYIGFWLPSALIGKLFHSIILGFSLQIVWATLGIFLFFYLLLAALKHKSYWPVLLFIFFSGLDAIGCLGTEYAGLISIPYSHMEWWYFDFQFSSFTTQLFWVFNQAIPLWVTVMLMYHEKNNKSLLFLYACLFLQSTLPALGLFPFMVYWYIKKGTPIYNPILGQLKKAFLSSLTWQNIPGALCVVVVTGVYLSANIAGGYYSFTQLFAQTDLWHWFVIFFVPEVGFYLLCIWPIYRKDPLYYLCAGCFLIYPFIQIGFGPDFCMRGTLPALVLLYVMIARTLENKTFRQGHRVFFYTLIILLGVGSITPLHEFTRTIHFTRLGQTKIAPALFLHNFFGYTKDNRFLKYFGK